MQHTVEAALAQAFGNEQANAITAILSQHGVGQGQPPFFDEEMAAQAVKAVTEEPDKWDEFEPLQSQAEGLGEVFAQKLQNAPDLEKVNKLMKGLPSYEGVPRTPPATSNFHDKQLQRMQAKLEGCMNLIIHLLEDVNGRQSSLGKAAGLVRSLYEDILQKRRQLFAGRQSHQLERREDDNSIRLLSREEEKKVNEKTRTSNKSSHNNKKYGRGRGYGGGWTNWSDGGGYYRRNSTHSTGKGEDGHGKGGGPPKKKGGKGKGGRGRGKGRG